MRQADSTIKGFLYQFDKSLFEILISNDNETITLEGQIEDIDIISDAGIETIQCKYHEKQDYSMSNVAEPMLEMFCHFVTHQAIGKKNTKYILYAYFQNNIETIDQADFHDFLIDTKNQDILVKYFPRIFMINNSTILELANKGRKTHDDKKKIKDYFISNKSALLYKVPLENFFEFFVYRKAEKHEILKQKIIAELSKNVDSTTATELYYPNAFARIAEMSSLPNSEHREISKSNLWHWLNEQKTMLLNKWIFGIRDKKVVLKSKKAYLSPMFSGNSDVRVFIFSNAFFAKNKAYFTKFIIEYLSKYYTKRKLQKPPIFIFETNDTTVMNEIIKNLFDYQITVNNGIVGGQFVESSFINSTNCSNNFSARIALAEYIRQDIFRNCNTNYLFYIGNQVEPIIDTCFATEVMGIATMSELKYLVGLAKTFEEEM